MAAALPGTIAVTDYDWYLRLVSYPALDEVNFWKPSAGRPFHAPAFSPFLFKLKAPRRVVCGFGYFARYSVLPDWLAWDAFSVANGSDSLTELRARLRVIRQRIGYKGSLDDPNIGCILVVQPVFFPPDLWVEQPNNWKDRTLGSAAYDLSLGEGARVWDECIRAAASLPRQAPRAAPSVAEQRYGTPTLIAPRLGQGTFRITVTDIYGRCCAVTEEHSLPALEAAHIRPYSEDGPHDTRNGLLLRADFHRLFDKGYLTVTDDARLVVGQRLREDFENGRSYYPFDGKALRIPPLVTDQPAKEFLAWHRENCFLG